MKMNNLDKDYLALCEDILNNGTKKKTRTGTDSISVFGRQIRHKMSDGFPLITTKKMYWKGIVTELLWFLRGDTNIKFLLDNDCHIWDGDAHKNYVRYFENKYGKYITGRVSKEDGEYLVVNKNPLPKETIQNIIYSKEEFINKIKTDDEFAKKWGELGPIYGKQWRRWKTKEYGIDEPADYSYIDQITNLISELKTNPDSRRLMVSAWNVGELDQMTLPPCHYGFQVYTRELSLEERYNLIEDNKHTQFVNWQSLGTDRIKEVLDEKNIPTRAISLMWNQRSVDVPLGLPFNIASYGLLLEIIAKTVNMVPEMLIGSLGDCHIYENQIEGIEEQLTRESFDLPTLNINDEFWNHEYQTIDGYIKSMEIGDFQVENYQSHPAIKMPLSN